MKKIIRAAFNRMGYEIIPKRWTEVPLEKEKGFDADFLPMYEKCKPYTMTSMEKMHALFRAIRYLEINGVKGDIVECGVAAGGSSHNAVPQCFHDRPFRGGCLPLLSG